MKISEVAERTGVPASTLRYYERLGILTAGRSRNGYRDFDEGHLERLDFIASAKRLGLELPEIRRLLELADDGTCTGVKAALQPLLAEQIAAVEQQLKVLSRFAGPAEAGAGPRRRLPRQRRAVPIGVRVPGTRRRCGPQGLIARAGR